MRVRRVLFQLGRRKFKDETPKAPIMKEGLRKIIGVFFFVLPYKRAFILWMIALTVFCSTTLLFPFMGGKLLDAAEGKSTFFLSTVNQVTLGFGVIVLAQGLFSFLRLYFFSRFTERSIADLRLAVYQKMIWLPQTFFDTRRVGEL